jgi:hypothetical protein
MLVHVLAKSGEAAKSGPIGLAVILILCILCYFLFKSMSKHLRKVREQFPEPGASAPPPTSPAAPISAEPADAPPGQPAPTAGQPAPEPPAE